MSVDSSVVLLSRPTLIDLETLKKAFKVDWRVDNEATAAESLIEFCGRICYMSFGNLQSPKTNREYIAHLIRQGHESVLEHATWSFLAHKVTRSFTHQMVRHRIGFSFSQLSQQYVDHTMIEIADPADGEGISAELQSAWTALKEQSLSLYAALLRAAEHGSKEDRRQAHSLARSVLPNATTTAVAFTANARALRHFLKVRGNIVGDLEMRSFSASMLRILMSEAPSVFQDFEVVTHDDGLPLVRHHADFGS